MSDVKITFSAETSAAEAAVQQLAGRVQSHLQSIVSSVLAGFSIHAVKEWIAGQIEAADQANKTAQKIGFSTEALTAYGYAAKLADVEQGEFTIGMKTLAQQLVDAARGSDLAVAAFQQLGLNIQNADGTLRNLDQLLPDLADAFQRMPDGVTKSDLAVQLFGRSGINLIPLLNQGAAGLAKLREEAERFGVIVRGETAQAAEEFNDNLSRLKFATQGYALTIAEAILPNLVAFTDELVRNAAAAAQNREKIEGIAAVLKTLATLFTAAYYGLKIIFDSVVAQVTAVVQAVQHMWEITKDIFDAWLGVIKQIPAALREILPALVAVGKAVIESFTGKDASGSIADATLHFLKAFETLSRPLAAAGTNLKLDWQTLLGSLRDLWKDWINGVEVDAEKFTKLFDALWNPSVTPPEKKSTGSQPITDPVKATKSILDDIQKAFEDATFSRQQLLDAEYARGLEELTKSAKDYQEFLDGKALLDEIYAKKSADLAEETQRKILETQNGALSNKIQTAQGNRFLTQDQKDAIIGPLLQAQINANRSAQSLELGRLDIGNEDDRLAAQQRLNELKGEEIQLTQQLANMDRSFGATLRAGIAKVYDEWSSLGANLVNGTLNAIQSAIDALSDSIAGLITGTRTWGQVWTQIGTQIIAMIVRILLQQLAALVIATAANVAAGFAVDRAWKEPAIDASIASYGAAAVEGGAVYEATKDSLLFAASGGYVSGPGSGTSDSIPARLSNGEFVVNARATAIHRELLHNINAMRGVGPRVQPITSSTETLQSAAPGLQGGGGGAAAPVNVQAPPAQIFYVDSEEKLKRLLESQAFGRAVVHHVAENKSRLGLPT